MAKKKTDKQIELDNQFHLRNGYPPDFELKGVKILSKNPKPVTDPEKGVEIHDQRHG